MLFPEAPLKDAYRRAIWGPGRAALTRAPAGTEVAVSRLLGRIAKRVAIDRRSRVEAALLDALGAAPDVTVSRVFETHFVHQYAGFLWHKIDAQNSASWLRFEGLSYLDDALAKGGVVVAQPHMGLPQLPLHALGLRGYAVVQVAGGANAVSFSRTGAWAVERRRALEQHLRARLVEGRGYLRPILRELAAGHIVFTAADGTGGGNEIGRREVHRVCGRPYAMPVFPAWLSSHAGVPVVPLACWAEGARWVARFEAPLDGDITEKLAGRLESWLRDHPGDWHFWDVWHAGPGGVLRPW